MSFCARSRTKAVTMTQSISPLALGVCLHYPTRRFSVTTTTETHIFRPDLVTCIKLPTLYYILCPSLEIGFRMQESRTIPSRSSAIPQLLITCRMSPTANNGGFDQIVANHRSEIHALINSNRYINRRKLWALILAREHGPATAFLLTLLPDLRSIELRDLTLSRAAILSIVGKIVNVSKKEPKRLHPLSSHDPWPAPHEMC